MANPVNPPRGMRDFLPADKARREHALGIIKGVYRAHGFDEIETPVVEDYARLHSGLGGDNEKLSFSILKRGITAEALAAAAEAGDVEQLADLGLRFDLTVPLTRFYATHRAELPPVFRAIQIAPVWRAERPQKGRYRQFVQADIDIIGEPGILAEIELVTATSQVLAELGLAGCVIRVNDRRILFGLLGHCGFAPETHDRALITVDKLDKIGTEGVVAELREIDPVAAERMGEILAGVEPALAGSGIPLTGEAIAAVLPVGAAEDGIANLTELGAALDGVLPEGVSVCFDPTLVRGMGYYTGTIFEVAHPGSGSSVGGGGRYDGMVGRFLGQDVPAVGFSIGFERVVDLITLPEATGPEAVALVYDAEVAFPQLVALKRELVARGHRVRLEKRQKNMKTLLARVAAEGFTSIANVRAETATVADLELRPLSA
ncbi:histidine--tRNA ligase [Leucobacter chromiireducens]|uniref:Histidine--tRNA ligase n=1 Tax=Leucobacter chromiireducens subsp. solipictus TaxID=398235 RepID=A0ABS1SEG4_9MICO|nr:histidine--tRNA ligase [Leucobacter chromiireducens]MBL3678301.1 histidine--tRNA ligase [Leucobacter chromiireducens subsp. solipictus]